MDVIREPKTDKNKVLILKLSEADVDGFMLNYDYRDDGTIKYMEEEFTEALMDYIPEYAMGYDNSSILPSEIRRRYKEAAQSIIKIKNIDDIKGRLESKEPMETWPQPLREIYEKKGIFSELILHFILREFKESVPLISKIYFKDSISNEAHGFDAVHIVGDTLWLGETKFYKDGKSGINCLIEDLRKHFNKDYLNEQFIIISRALVHNPIQQRWINKLNEAKLLKDKFQIIVIPLLCIYQDSIADEILKRADVEKEYDTVLIDHVSSLKEYFDLKNDYKNKNRVKILLILFPVKSKDELIGKMLEKIYHGQSI